MHFGLMQGGKPDTADPNCSLSSYLKPSCSNVCIWILFLGHWRRIFLPLSRPVAGGVSRPVAGGIFVRWKMPSNITCYEILYMNLSFTTFAVLSMYASLCICTRIPMYSRLFWLSSYYKRPRCYYHPAYLLMCWCWCLGVLVSVSCV